MLGSFANTFDTLLALQHAVEESMNSDFFGSSTINKGIYPNVNIFKEEGNSLVTVELPGVKKEDIKIEIKNNLLRLSGKRKCHYPDQSSAHRLERKEFEFDRTIKLDSKIDQSKVKADFQDGVLGILLPMAEEEKPKQIEIS